ncbi:MAG: acetylglutamate kinase [Proteobacteria bacterium]|nr:MAG: acetylglutamate kinase [Pseudomonadota bacterium]
MDKLYLFKIGGKVVDKPEALDAFLKGFAAIKEAKILVHGGGVIAEQLAERLDIPTQMVKGRRVTSLAMRDLVTMVYGGQLNKSLVAKLQQLGCDAIGLTGADARMIRSKKRDPEPIDYGYVGDVTEVRVDLLETFIGLGLTAVFAPLSYDEEILNTNADGIASALARGLSKRFDVTMLYGFEQAGVLVDVKDKDSLIERLDRPYYERLLGNGIITEGMLPKLEECFKARRDGVQTIVLAEAMACLAYAKGEAFRGTLIDPAD